MKRIAAIQMASGPNVGANLIEVERLIGSAVKDGAGLVVLPENFAHMGHLELDKLNIKEVEGKGPIQDFLSDQAAKHKVWLVGGTIPIASPTDDRVRAACLVFNDKGEQVGRYDKIHLFDVELIDSGECYAESQAIEAGNEITVLETPYGKLGVAICYDLRFPELFRRMLDLGADIVAVPSAFTALTGRAHWEILVRARAVENLSYIIASAQGGYHVNGRETYGNSMIVDPWGRILDRLPSGSGFVVADVSHELLSNTRRNFPAIAHRKL